MKIAEVEVACDESGNEGENLFASGSTVFVHASTDIDAVTAANIMDQVRADTRSQAPEIKSKTLLSPANEDVLLALLQNPDLHGRVSVHLTEKRFFLASKLVDLIVEEVMHERGEDIYRDRRARAWAWILYREAPAQLGPAWTALLDAFNELTWRRPGQSKASETSAFLAALDDARSGATGRVAHILRIAHAGEPHVLDLAREASDTSKGVLRNLDPIVAAVGQTARTWHERTNADIRIVHDEAPAITTELKAALMLGLSAAATAELGVPPVSLVGINTVDSKLEPRVQVADLFAGVARVCAQDALAGNPNEKWISALRPHLNDDSIWGDASSWFALYDRELHNDGRRGGTDE